MQSYKDLLWHILNKGHDRTDRTGVGTRSVFGYQWRHDLQKGFPLLTTKKIHTRSVIHELIWFLRGETNIRYLKENGVTIWDEWADEKGDLGPVYGHQWRKWGYDRALHECFGVDNGRDQVDQLINDIRHTPDSRRLIVTAWNPDDVPRQKLPPCHCLWQCYVGQADNSLSLHLYQRSCDAFLGLPFNIASYGILLTLLARVTGLMPKELIVSFGDLHIYKNHFKQVATQLDRAPRPLPDLFVNVDVDHSFDLAHLRYEDLWFSNYDPHPAIHAPVAV